MSGRERSPAARRDEYVQFTRTPTRWADNDAYGHVNNVVYYAWFDSAVNRVLIGRGGLDPHAGEAIGLCVESGCRYRAPVSYPADVDVGLRVGSLGKSSVRYELAVFLDDRDEAIAEGFFVHVFVDRETRRPREIPERLRAALEELVLPTSS